MIDGSHITKPYTPMLHKAYCRLSKITILDLNAAAKFLTGLIPCCSCCNFCSKACFSSSVNHLAFFGLSSTRYHQKKAHITAGSPSRINIHRQPTALIRYPDKTDIQSMVAGLPRIKKVFARERSVFVNHLLKKISIAGITALSTTPSINRI